MLAGVRSRPAPLAVLAACAAVLALAPAAGAAGLRLVSTQRLDARLSELTLRTSAVAGPAKVRVLLPAGYAREHRRYPVLYLLHGALGDQTSWTVQGDAEAITARYPVIVVMPASGSGGGYVDWFNAGRFGPPEWETYHVDQLIPFVDHRYRTVARRGGRAVAGLSMGGFGAMSYAARHPDTFAAAAAFSGAVDTNNPLDIAITGDEPWGPRTTEEIRWRGSNPLDLAGNLRGLRLVVRTGSGEEGGPFGGGDIVETVVHQMNVAFNARLDALGIAHTWDDYGPGGHTWPYWQRDLRETLPQLMATFAQPAAPPARITYRSIEPRYSAYGWRVAVRRPALEWSTLGGASRRGFTLSGSGSATVTTPRTFAPRARIRATVRGHSSMLRADGAGRLRVALRLGPSNAAQALTAGATTRVFRVRVTLRPAR
jgi:S-formylglutathione hydrolase FrmB